MAEQPVVDWEAIERDYRAGVRTLRQIGTQYGLTEAAIRKRAKREEWPRDLSERIAQKAAEKVRKTTVRNEVRKTAAYQSSEREIIEATAQVQADIILGHRQDVPKARRLMQKLLAELEGETDALEDLDRIADILKGGDEAKMADLFRKLNSLPGRIDSGKKLAEAMKTCITLEREVFNIEGARTPGKTLDEFLDALKDA